MTSQYIWIGIAVSVFVAGIGIGYGVWQSSTSGLAGMMMSPQQMNQMMNNPEAMQQIALYDAKPRHDESKHDGWRHGTNDDTRPELKEKFD
ncbi:hypothetical protein [Nitrosopumilus sp.]|uniref:hypothetical protein n=1 Tax=Nitrosopumilus sp. TaxID=2024843 RepID=UPI00292F0AF4|nr:hypothetical protein [Nitrosopumilus sp.]